MRAVLDWYMSLCHDNHHHHHRNRCCDQVRASPMEVPFSDLLPLSEQSIASFLVGNETAKSLSSAINTFGKVLHHFVPFYDFELHLSICTARTIGQ